MLGSVVTVACWWTGALKGGDAYILEGDIHIIEVLRGCEADADPAGLDERCLPGADIRAVDRRGDRVAFAGDRDMVRCSALLNGGRCSRWLKVGGGACTVNEQ